MTTTIIKFSFGCQWHQHPFSSCYASTDRVTVNLNVSLQVGIPDDVPHSLPISVRSGPPTSTNHMDVDVKPYSQLMMVCMCLSACVSIYPFNTTMLSISSSSFPFSLGCCLGMPSASTYHFSRGRPLAFHHTNTCTN